MTRRTNVQVEDGLQVIDSNPIGFARLPIHRVSDSRNGSPRFLIHVLKVKIGFVQENDRNYENRLRCADATKPVQPIVAKAKKLTFFQRGMQVIDSEWLQVGAFDDFQTEGRNEFRAGKQSKS